MEQTLALCIYVDDDLQLRLLEICYAEAYFSLTERNRAYLQTWEPWVSYNGSLEHTRAYMKRTLYQFVEGLGLQCGIWYQGQLVGAVGLNGVDQADQKAEIGYWIDEDMQRKGIVTRACQALLSLAFTQYDLHRIEIHCATENKRSRAIPERLGFTLEGIHRQSQMLNGHHVDMAVYGLLLDEWTSHQQ